jgi:predicted acyl esterase
MGGYQQLVRAEVMRGRFRDGFAAPKPFVPNEPALVRFALPDIAHAFRSGHRIMVQIQSTWFPLVDRNPQTFVPNISEAKESDFTWTTHKVMRSPAMTSSIRVSLTAGALPGAPR